eukprot:scaffold8948_cov59-Attheya_sp.AAC.2
MLRLSRLLVAVSVLAAQGGTFVFVTAREEEEEGRGLRGLIDENDSTQDRKEIFKDEDHLKPPNQYKLSGDNIHPLELSLLNGASNRVVGGKDTSISQYPYFARIDLGGTFLCGGTLISREFILTAAHCNYPGDMTVTLGTDTRKGTGIKFAVVEKIPHPKYRVGNPDIYDVLLLRLQGTAPDSYVNNIPRLDDGKSNENKDAFNVIGLGTQHEYSSHYPSKLQVATLNRVDQTECKNRFFYRTRLEVSADMLCAHAIGKDACQGDSGGPLVIVPNASSHPSDHILVGLTSWGVGCADDFLPGVYARVSYVLGWIKGTICQQSLLSSYVTNTGTTQLCINLQGIAASRSGSVTRRPRTRRSRRNGTRKRRSTALSAILVCRSNESARHNCPMTCNTCPL